MDKYILFFIGLILTALPSWGQAEETVEIKISIETEQQCAIDAVSAVMPPLKFNKRMLISYTLDDDTVTAYGNIFCIINQNWVEQGKPFHHLNGETTETGFMPVKTLGYTDGAGIEKRFAFGVAIWSQAGNKWVPNFMSTRENPGGSHDPYLKWYEIPLLLDFGSTVYAHDTELAPFLPNATEEELKAAYKNADLIAQGWVKDLEITRQKLGGRGFITLMEPNGNYTYCEAKKKFAPLKVVCNQGAGGKSVTLRPLSMTPDFENTVFERRFFRNIPIAEEFAYLQSQYNNPDPIWYHLATHRADKPIMDLLAMINDTYGKDGSDTIWFATVDEYYQYAQMRKNTIIGKSVEGNKIVFTLAIPRFPDNHYQDFSLIISGIGKPDKAKISVSDSANSFSYAAIDGDKLLINAGFNPELIQRVEKYVQIYKSNPTNQNKCNALYFINQLRPELKQAWEKRMALESDAE